MWAQDGDVIAVLAVWLGSDLSGALLPVPNTANA